MSVNVNTVAVSLRQLRDLQSKGIVQILCRYELSEQTQISSASRIAAEFLFTQTLLRRAVNCWRKILSGVSSSKVVCCE
jgi:hypothetical protein